MMETHFFNRATFWSRNKQNKHTWDMYDERINVGSRCNRCVTQTTLLPNSVPVRVVTLTNACAPNSVDTHPRILRRNEKEQFCFDSKQWRNNHTKLETRREKNREEKEENHTWYLSAESSLTSFLFELVLVTEVGRLASAACQAKTEDAFNKASRAASSLVTSSRLPTTNKGNMHEKNQNKSYKIAANSAKMTQQ